MSCRLFTLGSFLSLCLVSVRACPHSAGGAGRFFSSTHHKHIACSLTDISQRRMPKENRSSSIDILSVYRHTRFLAKASEVCKMTLTAATTKKMICVKVRGSDVTYRRFIPCINTYSRNVRSQTRTRAEVEVYSKTETWHCKEQNLFRLIMLKVRMIYM